MYIGWDGKEYEDAELAQMRQDMKEEGHMTTLVFVEIDGSVADASARFSKAEEAKQAFMYDIQARTNAIMTGKNTAQDAYWREAFNPELVTLDTLIEGADECINALELVGAIVIFLTSRPAAMREATLAWLEQYDLLVRTEHARLVMKHPAFQFDKTLKWKAGMVQTLAAMFGADEVLFIDPVQVNREAVQDAEHAFVLRCASSLDAAVNGEPEADESGPF